ncbi:Hypothetical protein PHPALM_7760 [Phytophthora palmivora]|uniref:BED-type domain-containing protein n=1 Tax=Phytophthora palmivora TaxID=4796 RepID=A0A2P4YBI2_9STRA|nr:Hypothetical protein PHPALM_7760 [Phytophthora palmivora]
MFATSQYHVCKACGKRRNHKPMNGYTNLVSHVRAAHPRFESEMWDATAAVTGTLVPLATVSVNTLLSNMESVTKALEKSIDEEMPDEFGLMLDGWSHGTEHYRPSMPATTVQMNLATHCCPSPL